MPRVVICSRALASAENTIHDPDHTVNRHRENDIRSSKRIDMLSQNGRFDVLELRMKSIMMKSTYTHTTGTDSDDDDYCYFGDGKTSRETRFSAPALPPPS